MLATLPALRQIRHRCFIFSAFLLSLILPVTVQAQTARVQVVLFYSPLCGHCQQVIAEDIPPIVQAYNSSFTWRYFGDPPDEESGQLPPLVAFEGNVLQILYVDTTTQIGGDLYRAAVERYHIPAENQVVPIMVVGEKLLIGGSDIPNKLPDLVDAWLLEGGLGWPDIPGLEKIVTSLMLFPDQIPATPTQEPEGSPTGQPVPSLDPDPSESANQAPAFEFEASKLSVLERIQLDPVGNTLSIVVLIGMLFSLVGAALRWRINDGMPERKPLPRILPLLILLGVFVAGYLSLVETTGAEAVCGPVGDCKTVQSSEYAILFGRVPVGILGLFTYLGMLVAWLVGQRAPAPPLLIRPVRFLGLIAYVGRLTIWLLSPRPPAPPRNFAVLSLFGMALIGVLFSIYLTFLEPFVIGATCMWCLSSAIVVTLIMLLSVEQARAAYKHIRSGAG
jgi:uncharacterized membrane protein